MRLFLAVMIVGEMFTFQNIMASDSISDSTQNQILVIKRIVIIGNKITKPWIIHRELSVSEGDTMTRFELLNHLETSKQNLTNISLFNSIDMRFVLVDDVNAEIYILVTERWYLWPRPVFELAETNFNSWLENKDFSRINYGLELIKNNFRGRNERLKLVVQFGWTELLSIAYSIPYINKKRTLGMSVFAGYGQNHEVNYLSFQNKRLFYKDVIRIQEQTFKSGFNFKYRKKFYSTHLIGADYNAVSVTDSVLFYNSNYLSEEKNDMKYFSLTYRYILDKRDNKNYALTGLYLSGTLIKYGLNIYSSSLNLWWNKLEYKQYWKLSEKFFLAGMAQVHYYFSDFQPYYLRDGLGYTDKSTVRSYELYVIDAQQMGTAKLQLKYQLVSPKAYEMSFVPINKFKQVHYSLYLGIFGDVGYAADKQDYPENDFANDLQMGYGISLDLATYYDLVFRAEYSVNKFGEHGLFLHFVAPI